MRVMAASVQALVDDDGSLAAQKALCYVNWKVNAQVKKQDIGSENSEFSAGLFPKNILVRHITSAEVSDMKVTKTIILSLPLIMDKLEFFSLLMERFSECSNTCSDDDTTEQFEYSDGTYSSSINPVQIRVCNVLIHWCLTTKEDFYSDRLKVLFKDFVDNRIQESKFAALRLRLLEATKGLNLESVRDSIQLRKNSIVGPVIYFTKAEWITDKHALKSHINLSCQPTNNHRDDEAGIDAAMQDAFVLNRGLNYLISGTSVLGSPSTKSFLGLDPLFFCEQLSFVAQGIFRSISSRDLINYTLNRFREPSARVRVSSIEASIYHTNYLSSLTITTIFLGKKDKLKKKIFERFVRLSEHLIDCRNHSSFMAIMAGLNSYMVTKEKAIRDFCKKKKICQRMDRLMCETSNIVSSKYKSIMDASPTPCVPYLNLFIGSLNRTLDKPVITDANGNVDIEKLISIADILDLFQLLKYGSYVGKINSYVLDLFLRQPVIPMERASIYNYNSKPADRSNYT